MFTDLANFLTGLLSSFRTVFRIGGVPAAKIELQPEHTKLNFSAVVVATVLYYVVCSMYYAFTNQAVTLFGSAVVAAIFVVTSVFLIFFVSLAVALFDGRSESDQRSDLWATLLAHVWIVSLIAFGIDLLPTLLWHRSPLGMVLASWIPKIDVSINQSMDFRQEVVVAFFYTAVALVVVALRSKFVLGRSISGAFVGGLAVALVFNVAFFYVMVFKIPTLSPHANGTTQNAPHVPADSFAFIKAS